MASNVKLISADRYLMLIDKLYRIKKDLISFEETEKTYILTFSDGAVLELNKGRDFDNFLKS